MSDLEQRLYFALGEKEKRVFTIQDITTVLNVSSQHARNLAARMVQIPLQGSSRELRVHAKTVPHTGDLLHIPDSAFPK